LTTFTLWQFEAGGLGAQEMVLASLGTRINPGAVHLIASTMERTAIDVTPVNAGDSFLVTTFFQSLKSLAFRLALLVGVSVVGANVNFARVEKLIGVETSNTDTVAKRSTKVAETSTETRGSDKTSHATLAPFLGLGWRWGLAATTVATWSIIVNSVGITNQVVTISS